MGKHAADAMTRTSEQQLAESKAAWFNSLRRDENGVVIPPLWQPANNGECPTEEGRVYVWAGERFKGTGAHSKYVVFAFCSGCGTTFRGWTL